MAVWIVVKKIRFEPACNLHLMKRFLQEDKCWTIKNKRTACGVI